MEVVNGLAQWAQAYYELLLARGNTAKHAADTWKRIKRVIEQGSITSCHEFDEPRVLGAVRHMGACTANHHLRAVRSFLIYLGRRGVLVGNPLAGLRWFNEARDVRHPRRVLSHAEQERLLAFTFAGPTRAGVPGQLRAMLYETALRTGLRAGELRHLRGADVLDVPGRAVLRVRASISKNGKPMLLPLPQGLDRRLLAHARRRGRAQRMFDMPHPCNVVRVLRRDLRAAGIEYRTVDGIADFHALRHTFVSSLTQANTDLHAAQLLARHCTVAMTMRYSHRNIEALAHAIDRLQPLRGALACT